MKWLKRIGVILLGIVLAGIYSYRTWPVAIYDTNIDSAAYENVGELKEGASTQQRFVCKHNGLEEIQVSLSNLGVLSDAKYHWSLQESKTGEIVGEGSFASKDIDNSKKTEFHFETQENSKKKEYLFVIEAEEKENEQGITVMKTKATRNQKENVVLDGTEQDGVMVLSQQIYYLNIETGIVFVGIYLYFVLFMRFLLRLFK